MKRTALQRKTRLERRTPMGRTSRMPQRRSTKRRSSRIENPEYLAWLRRQPCGLGPLRGTHPLGHLIGRCGGRIDPDHERHRVGAGQTASDHRAWPCCRTHHDQRHGTAALKSFWGALGLDQEREVIAERIDHHWARYQAQLAAVHAAAPATPQQEP